MPSASAAARAGTHAVTLRDTEQHHILRTLKETRWVMGGPEGGAARLALKRTTLQALVKRLGIDRPSSQANISAPAKMSAAPRRHSPLKAQAGTGRNFAAFGD